ncbi:hypothetical protein [Dictyobacter arantiisoli]|uniref:Uncharacterized protein n=1 Tax=Dictyobacter arantiisoli TaxID=2014874 RepID=A0A5A5T9Z8_9CHLR|nr:hypothetical protein [Dictyobacter arantiisoli]GCF08085.1 hypothetical protein KDI_16490 [Dictyobacter arantiisoli]
MLFSNVTAGGTVKTVLNALRNLLFDIYPEQFVKMKAGFRSQDIFKKQLYENTLINEPEEIQVLAKSEAEKYTRPFARRMILIATREHIEKTYATNFVKYYTLAVTSSKNVKVDS